MSKILYLTSSSYSGSTLLTFLLNQHPDIYTIGELEGWDYGDEQYRCSCGDLIEECIFFQHIRAGFENEGLPFSTRNFGTKLRLSNIRKINRYLTATIPYVNSSTIEQARDALVWHMPGFRQRFQRVLKSNETFICSALNYSHASVFFDATKSPFRLRMLKRVNNIDLQVLYMVRDIHGVVASNVRKKDISVAVAARQWLVEQDRILRVLKDFPGYTSLYYEDLCTQTNSELSQIYSSLKIQDYEFEGNVREGEHHILGNVMRLGNINEIRLDTRSKTELSKEQTTTIRNISENYLKTCNNLEVHNIVSHYLGKV